MDKNLSHTIPYTVPDDDHEVVDYDMYKKPLPPAEYE
jgi:hypothetical protein